jgi:type IV secretory pathway TraG/TraD family ATPase VirD4
VGRERKGWLFLTSKPTMRERLRPLMSLWLDLLVLRLMNEGGSAARKTWFVLDELASAATVAAVDDGDHGGPEIE